MEKIKIYSLVTFLFLLTCCNSFKQGNKLAISGHSQNESGYYIDGVLGADNNPGTMKRPLKSIEELNLRLKRKAENIFFKGGQTFRGTLILSGIKVADSIKIHSWGVGKATIDGNNAEAIIIENCQNILIKDLDIKGNGRKNGNKTNGLSIRYSGKCSV